MGNNNHEPYEVNRFIEASSSSYQQQQQQQSPNQQRQRQSSRVVGLTPSDGAGQDAYKRSANSRSTRRSRSERISYLMATGHLDLEETRQLTKQTNPSSSNNINNRSDLEFPTIATNKKNPSGPAGGDQELYDYANKYNIKYNNNNNNDSIINNFDKNIFSHNSKKSKKSNSNHNYKNNSNNYNNKSKTNHSSTGNFKRTYTEVTLPMKTSPAFEYLIQDDKRRNKRCCLWLLYFILITICLAIIAYCSVQVFYRHQQNRF